jgi:hypothetical protein
MSLRKSRKAEKPPATEAKPYEPTPLERELIDAFMLGKSNSPAPRVKITSGPNGGCVIANNHPDGQIGGTLLANAIGTVDDDFVFGFLSQLTDASSKGGKADERALNFMLAVVKGVEPRDQIEAMLAAHMSAIHVASMTFARRLEHVGNIPQQDSAQNALNKLTRTFAA